MITLYVALGSDSCIHPLPWIPDSPSTKKHYYEQISGHPVIICHKMWEFFDRNERIFTGAKPVFVYPTAGRNKVTLEQLPEGAVHFETTPQAIGAYWGLSNTEIFVLGGIEVFDYLLHANMVQRIMGPRITQQLKTSLTLEQHRFQPFKKAYISRFRKERKNKPEIKLEVWVKNPQH